MADLTADETADQLPLITVSISDTERLNKFHKFPSVQQKLQTKSAHQIQHWKNVSS